MMPPLDCMLDLETFSTRPNAAIVQIGACFFDPKTWLIGKKFHVNVNLASSVLAGLHVDPATVKWWSDRDYSHLLLDAKPLDQALLLFKHWYLDEDPSKGGIQQRPIWSHGAAFDVPVLASAYHALGLEPPWHYRDVLDTRTVFKIASALGWAKEFAGEPAHQALHDAEAQAIEVQNATRRIFTP